MDETPDFTCNSLQVLGNEISTSLSCQYNINQKIMCNFSFSLVHNVNFYCGSMLCCPFLTSIFTFNYQSAITRSYLCQIGLRRAGLREKVTFQCLFKFSLCPPSQFYMIINIITVVNILIIIAQCC